MSGVSKWLDHNESKFVKLLSEKIIPRIREAASVTSTDTGGEQKEQSAKSSAAQTS